MGRARTSLRQLLLAVVSIAGLGLVADNDESAPVQVQFPLLYKVLTFDRNRISKSETELVLGIAFQGRFRSSALLKDEAQAAAVKFADVLAPRKVTVVLLDLDDGTIDAILDRYKPGVLYLAPVRALPIADIVTSTRKRGIATMTGIPKYVQAGIAVGIGLRGDRPEIIVNVRAARAEGSAYTAQLLKLARLVDEDDR